MPNKFETAFAQADKDGSGTIDLAEAQQIVKALGFDYTEAQVETFFKKYDADNSGTLNKSEAEALVREVYPAAFE
ncbi:Oidioi.mRNA.OKI2018_I69.PAR.g8944.t1.cds [Oikopleura dioica]|uniref:Oidioi.mRNA.OKI2018_I69.PAR.g8944.t1.cds n=1 Tax=Oikopleura dioica TaxID=34765 RepID=A0ABN7RIC5_OIKDI|nr:Oidioi.mRNA.OKI2018_I69.PAR.g8944.t1.cds [Oikopleura dioica]